MLSSVYGGYLMVCWLWGCNKCFTSKLPLLLTKPPFVSSSGELMIWKFEKQVKGSTSYSQWNLEMMVVRKVKLFEWSSPSWNEMQRRASWVWKSELTVSFLQGSERWMETCNYRGCFKQLSELKLCRFNTLIFQLTDAYWWDCSLVDGSPLVLKRTVMIIMSFNDIRSRRIVSVSITNFSITSPHTSFLIFF